MFTISDDRLKRFFCRPAALKNLEVHKAKDDNAAMCALHPELLPGILMIAIKQGNKKRIPYFAEI